MKNTKKVFALVLVLSIVLSTVAFAQPAIPAGNGCCFCGGTVSNMDIIYGEWEVVSDLGTSILCRRTVFVIYECSRCGNMDTYSHIENRHFSPDELPID